MIRDRICTRCLNPNESHRKYLCDLCAEKSHQNYLKTRHIRLPQTKIKRASKREWYNELKHSIGCSKCGETHPACLEFHHTNPSIKRFMISQALFQFKDETIIKAEIEKCVLLCSNCHKKHHYQERHHDTAYI